MILGVGPTFRRSRAPNGNSPSPLSRNIVSNQIPYKERKDRCSELEQRDRLSGRLWFSLVRLSMLRHLFIDLLEYGGLVSSMLNFYNSALDLI
ncbi:hypothetical protein H5410_002215 [Solanum commersonii]|uniref:Uncharacterized protein n=1 Tax=Solanum commersonii TaxID=4109 RepID=A0A9J6B1P4_SOLCO|nr:hypothetical protein H5410_002215 [Solanum commersonii]